MFIGNKEVQMGAVQKLLEATTYLHKANDSLMAIEPVFQDATNRSMISDFRREMMQMAERTEVMYLESAREAFK